MILIRITVWVLLQVKTQKNIIFTVTISFESHLIAHLLIYLLLPLQEPDGSSLQPRYTTAL